MKASEQVIATLTPAALATAIALRIAPWPVSGLAKTYPSTNSHSDDVIRRSSMCFAARWLATARFVRIVRSASGVMMHTLVPLVSPTISELPSSMPSCTNSDW